MIDLFETDVFGHLTVSIYVIFSHNKYAYIHIYIYMQNHNDTIIKPTSEDFLKQIWTSHFICNVWKGLL